MSQYAHLSILDPEFAVGVAQLPPRPLEPLSVQAFRNLMENHAASLAKTSFSETQLKVQDWNIPVPAGEIPVRTYVSQQDDGSSNPLIVWAHGGGFIAGGISTDDIMLQKLAVDLKLSIVNVGYRLAPEHPFPTGLNDTYQALKWAYKNAQQLNADTTKGFIIGGCSAGGNITAVLTHRAREDPELHEKLTGQILQVPSTLHMDAVPEKYKGELLSLEQNKDAPILDRKAVRTFFDNLGCTDPYDPDVSPLLWTSHKELPPAYLQICGLDPLRDEGLLYETLLREEGVKTKLDIYSGLPHVFETFFPTFAQSAKWNEDLRKGIKWLLRGGSE